MKRSRVCATARVLAVTGAVIALAGGCSAVVGGSAVKAGGPAPAAADPALLDSGNYPRRPRPPLGTVPNEDAGRVVEAQRMADAVVGPWEVDRMLVTGQVEHASIGVLPTLDSLADDLAPGLIAQAKARHFLLGFVSGRATPPPPAGQPAGGTAKILVNMVLRFATPEDAAAAAGEMAATNRGIARDGVPATELKIPRYPATIANMAAVHQGFEAESFTAHGPYVFHEYAGSKESAGVVADLIAKLLDLQGPAIDHFQATPVDQLAALPADPTGLLARTVPSTKPDANHAAVYQPHAALHFSPDPPAAQGMFNDAGVQRVSADLTSVYDAVDAPGAQRAAEGVIRIYGPWGTYKPTAGISGLPSARCFDRGPAGQVLPRFMCVATVDHYAFKATATQELDLHQVMAAQYLMLTAS
ncbi:DUF7373 family lipoprotein [Mycobacterium sp. 050134]|uniref:DUF7373 family lipoprotein n=1 Tax=Mycobacterium sp. 050134 TaxID=3096111 RepID=UPI002ED9E4AB